MGEQTLCPDELERVSIDAEKYSVETDFQSLYLNVVICQFEILENDYVGYLWLSRARLRLESNICNAPVGVWSLDMVRYFSAKEMPK